MATKTDAFEDLETSESFTDETFNFLQYNLRMFALSLGAGLCYTSSKTGQNLEVLYNEILYHLNFKNKGTSPSVIDKSAINIPLGWDSTAKIDLLKESLITLSVDSNFSDSIPILAMKRIEENNLKEKQMAQNAVSSSTLDELHQNFLEKIKVKIAKIGNNPNNNSGQIGGGGERDGLTNLNNSRDLMNDSHNLDSSLNLSSHNAGNTSAAAAASSMNTSGTGNPPGNDRQLADFFQNLLKKSSGAPAQSGVSHSQNLSQNQSDRLANSPLGAMLNKNKK